MNRRTVHVLVAAATAAAFMAGFSAGRGAEPVRTAVGIIVALAVGYVLAEVADHRRNQ